jgi:hypothetical protein
LQEIIDVLAKHGIVQNGIKRQAHERGFLGLRPPGEYKKLTANIKSDIENAKQQLIKLQNKVEKTSQAVGLMQFLSPNTNKYKISSAFQQHYKGQLESLSQMVSSEMLQLVLNEIAGKIGWKKGFTMSKVFNGGEINVLDTNTFIPSPQVVLEYEGGKVADMFFDAQLDIYTVMFKQTDFDGVSHPTESWPKWWKMKQVLEEVFHVY